MGKKVYLEKSSLNYLNSLKDYGFSYGLILGQVSDKYNFIVHFARTPVPKDAMENLVNCEKRHDDYRLVEIDSVIDHISNVIQMLPGGMTILGLFFVRDSDSFERKISKLSYGETRNLMSSVHNFMANNEFYFYNYWYPGFPKLIFEYRDNFDFNCNGCETHEDHEFNLEEVDCIVGTSHWHRINCYYDLEQLLPLYVKSISNVILHDKIMEILKYVRESVNKSVLSFNGEIKNGKDLVKAIREKVDETICQNTKTAETPCKIIVDLYTPCTQQFTNTFEVTGYTTKLKCFGALCSDVYLHEKATIDEAIHAVKEDIIRSLYSRLMMHCNSLLEDLTISATDETNIIHEPPRRMSVALPSSKVHFTDYLFPGEDSLSTLPSKEQLDIQCHDHELMYKSLEKETDASEIYSSHDLTNSTVEKSESQRSSSRYVLSASILLSLFVLILAILLKKIPFL